MRRPQLNIPSFVSQSLSYLAVLELGVACTDIQLSSHKLPPRWLYSSWQCVSYCWPDLQAHISTVGGEKNIKVSSHSNVQTVDSSIHLYGTLAPSALRYFMHRNNTRLSTPLQQSLPHTPLVSVQPSLDCHQALRTSCITITRHYSGSLEHSTRPQTLDPPGANTVLSTNARGTSQCTPPR